MELMTVWSLVVMVIVLTCFYIAGVCCDIRLDQSPSQVTIPGLSVKVSCIISGYSMTSNNIHWIRQKPEKGLEWIGRMNTGSGTDGIYADSLKGQFTLTEDVSTSTQFLEVKSLKPEDSAAYYCARATVTQEPAAPYKN
uniref:Ig-like domain-containing protein n=1 Tax=Hucho hucho TaxID=62062 RepID=A0A4W5PZ02_9TELE